MFDLRIFIRSHPRLISSPQRHQQSLSLGINPIDSAVLCYPHHNIGGIHSWNECRKFIVPVVCRMHESILWLHEPVCWLTIECQPTRARYKHFITICEHTSSFLSWWSSKQGLETLCNCSTFLFTSSQYISTHFFARPSISQDQATVFVWGCSHPGNFSVVPAEYGIQTSLCFLQWWFPVVCIHVEYIPSRRDRGTKSVRQDQHSLSISSTWVPYSASCQPF